MFAEEVTKLNDHPPANRACQNGMPRQRVLYCKQTGQLLFTWVNVTFLYKSADSFL
jgi:hypothetical protein